MHDQPPHPASAAELAGPAPRAVGVPEAAGTDGATSAVDLSVARRLKAQFAPAYLTLASIIQGVALSALVVRVGATYTSFDAAAWLLTAATLLVIVDIWHEYLVKNPMPSGRGLRKG